MAESVTPTTSSFSAFLGQITLEGRLPTHAAVAAERGDTEAIVDELYRKLTGRP